MPHSQKMYTNKELYQKFLKDKPIKMTKPNVQLHQRTERLETTVIFRIVIFGENNGLNLVLYLAKPATCLTIVFEIRTVIIVYMIIIWIYQPKL